MEASSAMKRNEAQGIVEKYARQSIRYFENGLKAIDRKEYEKASEFLWGSVAQIMKAAAANKGIKLGSHAKLWNYAVELSKELNDESIYTTFYMANYLHSNFYEVELSPSDVVRSTEPIKKLIIKILELLDLKDMIASRKY
jgi:hypothetical protein